MLYIKKFYFYIKIILILYIMSFFCVKVNENFIFPDKEIIVKKNLVKNLNTIIVRTTKENISGGNNFIMLLKNPEILCQKFRKFTHVNKTISCDYIEFDKINNKENSTKEFTSLFTIQKGSGKALLSFSGNLESNEESSKNETIVFKGKGNIKLIKFPNYFFEYFVQALGNKIGGEFEYDLKLEINKDNSVLNISGNILYGINFVPTFVYMPTEIINRFANQIISQALDFLIKNTN